MRNLVGEGYEAYIENRREDSVERNLKRRRLKGATESSAPQSSALEGGLESEKHIDHGDAPGEAAPMRHISDYIRAQELSMSDVILIRLVGRGAFGEVWLAQDYKRDRFVALKKYYYGEDRDGFNKACLREITLLRILGDHPNIVPFHGVIFTLPARYGPLAIPHPMSDAEYLDLFQRNGPHGVDWAAGETTRAGLWLAFDFYPYDLNAYMRSRDELAGGSAGANSNLPLEEVKTITHGILQALQHCHRNHILHRDIKSANILLDFQGHVKLADFGLARRVTHVRGGVLLDDILAQPVDLSCEMDPRLTNKVVTLWYRSPELLLGSREYTASSDIWSLGCLVYEMISGKPLFSAANEQQMIQLIFDKLPLPTDWSEAQFLPLYSYLKFQLDSKLPSAPTAEQNFDTLKQKVVAAAGLETWEFLLTLLAVNPASRATASDALKHPWITTGRKNAGASQKFKINMEQGVKGNSVTVRKERERLMSKQKQSIVRHVNSNNPATRKRLEELQTAIEKLQQDIKVKTQLVQTLAQQIKAAAVPADCQLEEGEIN